MSDVAVNITGEELMAITASRLLADHKVSSPAWACRCWPPRWPGTGTRRT
jgi:hypothetical protein